MILFNKIRILPLTPHITVLFGTWVVGDGRKQTICFLWDLDSNMRGVYFMFVCAYVQIKTYPTIFFYAFSFLQMMDIQIWWTILKTISDRRIMWFKYFTIRKIRDSTESLHRILTSGISRIESRIESWILLCSKNLGWNL